MDWIKINPRKPMILRGARQVGKTWLVRELAKLSGKQLLEINFESQPSLRELFESHDPAEIILNLESKFNANINPVKSLLFLDEIQAAPELLAKLRWFYEDMPELAVLAAGSLLEFTLAEHSFSMPVGRVGYIHVEPFSFEEFLMQLGYEKLLYFLSNWEWGQSFPLPIHEQCMRLIKEYMLIGGMPEAVMSWKNQRSFDLVAQIHEGLLLTYRDDFSKYKGRIARERLEEVLMMVPRFMGEKFVFSRVNRDVSSETIKKALDLLCMARVCHRVIASHGNGIPLGGEIKHHYFKALFLDTGLACSMLDVRLHQIKKLDDLYLINKGGLSEQWVGQLLRTIDPVWKEPHLYYWTREEKGSNAEVDYLIQHAGQVIPVEVKAGSTGTLKSLHYFMYLKGLSHAVRINSESPDLTAVQVKIHSGELVNYQLLSIPFYLIEQLPRLLDLNR